MNDSTAAARFPSEIQALKQEILSSLRCAMPGIVEAFDPETGTANVRPALKLRPAGTSGQSAGSSPLPLLYGVPVYLPEPREIDPGAACLLIFADFDVDAWLASGEAEEPLSGRRHSLSDAFAFVGFRTNGERQDADARH